MACEVAESGRVVLAVWGKPELDDLPRLEQTVRRVRLTAGPVIFISRVPPHAKAPEPQVRDAIVRMLNHFIELCASYHAVMEGSGVAAAGKRTVLSAIFLMTGRRKHYHVHSRCTEVAGCVPAEQLPELQSALRAFRMSKLLDDSTLD
jgi:hypothetical protein